MLEETPQDYSLIPSRAGKAFEFFYLSLFGTALNYLSCRTLITVFANGSQTATMLFAFLACHALSAPLTSSSNPLRRLSRVRGLQNFDRRR